MMYYELRIKDFRRLRRMTQKELAKKSKVNQSYISKLENNKKNLKSPTLVVTFNIADALKICPHILIKYNCTCKMNCCKICQQDFFGR